MNEVVTVFVKLVIIDHGITTKTSKEIWPWELPVYQEKFGEGCCEEVSIRECEASLPNAAEEFSKLSSALGSDEDTKAPFVELAYGRGKSGIKSLEKAILKSTRKPKAKVNKKVKEPKKKVAAKKSEPESAPKQEASRDPLG